jgi:hypothetical protein
MESLTTEMNNLSIQRPEDNYRRLVATIDHFNQKRRITEDWIEEHKKIILEYRRVFPDVSKSNEEVTDRVFRSVATKAELLLSDLIREIKLTRSFNWNDYYELCVCFHKMCELLYTEDELTAMMNGMKL